MRYSHRRDKEDEMDKRIILAEMDKINADITSALYAGDSLKLESLQNKLEALEVEFEKGDK